MELLNTETCTDSYLRTQDPCALKCFWEEEGILTRHEKFVIKSLPFRNYFGNLFQNDVKKFRKFHKCLQYSLPKLKLRTCGDVPKVLSCFNFVQSGISVRAYKRFVTLYGINKTIHALLHPVADTAVSALEKILPTKVTDGAGEISNGFFSLTDTIQNSVGNVKDSTVNFLKLIGSTTKNLITGATSSVSHKVEVVANALSEHPTTPGSDSLEENNNNTVSTSQDIKDLSKTVDVCSYVPESFNGMKSLLQGIKTVCADAVPHLMMGAITALVNTLIESAGDSIAAKVPDIVKSFKGLIKKFGGKKGKHKKTKENDSNEVHK